MKIDIEATTEELDEIGEAIVEQLPHLISDALDRQLSLPGYNVTVNAGAGLTAKLRADIASIREDTKAIIQQEMKRTGECICLRDELAAAQAINAQLVAGAQRMRAAWAAADGWPDTSSEMLALDLADECLREALTAAGAA